MVGLSIRVRARVPLAVLLVKMTELRGSEHHRANNWREKPLSMSVLLAKTHCGGDTTENFSLFSAKSWFCETGDDVAQHQISVLVSCLTGRV